MNTPAKTDRHIGEKSQIKLGPGETIADPRDPLELQLTSIWEMVLGTKPIGMRDNFFDLGGSTLLVRQLLARIKEISGKEIPLSTFFQAQTVEQLANVLRPRRMVKASILVGNAPTWWVQFGLFHYISRLSRQRLGALFGLGSTGLRDITTRSRW